MLRIGIMGCGIVAKYRHIPAIIDNPHIELAALFDPKIKKLRDMQETFGIAPEKCFQDMEEFMRQPLDVVSITSPASYHKENCLCAAKHGHAVLCEKPLALSRADGQEMIDIMREKNLPLWVGLVLRFTPVAQQIYQMIHEKAIGEVRSLRLIFNGNCHGKYKADDETGEYGINQRREGRMAEGGPLVDCGAHQIDLARWWMDSEIIKHTGFGAWVDEYEAPDHTWLHLEHANGAHTMIEISFSYCHTAAEPRSEFVYELIGTEGVIRYERESQLLVVHEKERVVELPHDNDTGFSAMYQELVKAYETGESELLATAQDGFVATQISLDSTKEAIANRKEIVASLKQ